MSSSENLYNGKLNANHATLAAIGILSETGYFPGHQGRQHIKKITCGQCGEEKIYTIKSNLKYDGVEKFLRQKGWEIGTKAKNHVCPDCRERTISERSWSRQDVSEAVQVADPDSTKRAPENTALLRSLLNHYDESEGVYRNGWTDARIARDLSIPVEDVTARRLDLFGPMNGLNAFDALRQDVDLFVDSVRESDQIAEAKLIELEALYRSTMDGIKDMADEKIATAQEHFEAEFKAVREALFVKVEEIRNDAALRMATVEEDYRSLRTECQAALALFQETNEKIDAACREIRDKNGA